MGLPPRSSACFGEKRPAFAVLAAATAGALAPSPVAAGEAAHEPAEPRGSWAFVFENDLFYDQDRNYTNGVRLEYSTPQGGAPEWLTRIAANDFLFAPGSNYLASYALGQNIYTPRDIDVSPAPPDQRPYGGWLYGEISLLGDNGERLNSLTLSLGVVGPASLAEQSQKFVHDLIGATEPLGWDDQLRNEPALLIAYERRWRAVGTDIGPLELELMPHLGAHLGNVFTFANAGATLRIGRNMPRDYGVPRIQPALPGAGYFEADRFGAYVFAGIDGRAVGRNIFLDGNSFRDGPSVDKNALVGDLQVGVAVVWKRVRLSYTRVFRTAEYDGQSDDDRFGAVSLSVRF